MERELDLEYMAKLNVTRVLFLEVSDPGSWIFDWPLVYETYLPSCLLYEGIEKALMKKEEGLKGKSLLWIYREEVGPLYVGIG